jgi:hypothetical protein
MNHSKTMCRGLKSEMFPSRGAMFHLQVVYHPPRVVMSHQKVPYHHQKVKHPIKRCQVIIKVQCPITKRVTSYPISSRVSHQGSHAINNLNILLEVWKHLSQVVGITSIKCSRSPSTSSKGPRCQSNV